LKFALEQRGLHRGQFCATSEDVALAKQLIRKAKKETPVIAKPEKPEAIENLDAILRVADGVMVARATWAWR